MEEAIYTAFLKGSLKLSKTGEWWHNGKPFTNKKLSDYFHKSIFWRENEQDYVIRIGKQQATFDLEDTPFFVLTIDQSVVPWKITLSDGTTEELSPTSLSLGPEDQIYCLVKTTHRARFSRAAHQLLLAHAMSEDEIAVAGKTVKLTKNV